MMKFLNFVLVIIPVLVNIAFVSLFQRKIFGLSQLRKGPNKVSIIGILQPINDAIKLFTKELVLPFKSEASKFLLSPVISFLFSLLLWASYPQLTISISLSLMFIYTVLSMGIYPMFLCAWCSNSSYATIGGVRGIAQTISYEISLGFVFLFYTLMFFSISLSLMASVNFFLLKFILFIPMFGMWVISFVAETNSTPFDFVEGESELVSGFNVEYGSVLFALIFMSEYSNILFLSFLTSWFFFSPIKMASIFMSTVMVFSWMWIRTTLPRFRYDLLMSLTWTNFLPATIFVLIMSLFMSL